MRLSANVSGIQRATADADARAARLARAAEADPAAVADDLVGMRQDAHQVAVNVQAIRATDRALGFLLDRDA